MSGRDTEWRDLAATDATDRLKDENPHHENLVDAQVNLNFAVARFQKAEAEVARLKAELGRLISAAELYAADQAKAEDPRCGLSQPVSVAEAEELNAALLAAGDALLAKPEQEGGG